ncbi:MAG: hypothetical protein HYZ29_24330 [Myxococcales bacterium]|nr:hypothetical protein [Myxococcales bacterium]
MSRAFALISTALLVACGDPVHTDAVDALGPEAHGVEPGPLHRPGQPCLVCHGGKGPGNLEFSVAGTVYKYADSNEPLANAIVKLVDQSGPSTIVGTNCVGNFFVQRTDFDPVFPLWTRIQLGSLDIEMSTPVFGKGSCAHCHQDSPTESSVGRIYVAPPGAELPGGSCP